MTQFRIPIPISQDQLANWFTYHAPTEDQIPKFAAIRAIGLLMAQTIVEQAPPSADVSASIRLVREAVMTANAAIACGGE